MPKPTKKEIKENDKQGFISRCIAYVKKEKPNMKDSQVAGYCYGIWAAHKKKD